MAASKSTDKLKAVLDTISDLKNVSSVEIKWETHMSECDLVCLPQIFIKFNSTDQTSDRK